MDERIQAAVAVAAGALVAATLWLDPAHFKEVGVSVFLGLGVVTHVAVFLRDWQESPIQGQYHRAADGSVIATPDHVQVSFQWRPLMPLTGGACLFALGLLLAVHMSLTTGIDHLVYALGFILPGGAMVYWYLRMMLAHRRARLAGLVTEARVTGVQGFGRSFLRVVRYTYVDHRGRERRGSSDFFISSGTARAWLGKRGLVLFSPAFPDVSLWLGQEVTDETHLVPARTLWAQRNSRS